MNIRFLDSDLYLHRQLGDLQMINNIKKIVNKQSIIQLTLIKVTLSIFAFLITFIALYGENYWEKMQLKRNYDLVSTIYNVKSEIQSQIYYIEKLKSDKTLSVSQKEAEIKNIIKPIISNSHYTLGFYDIRLDLSMNSDLVSNFNFEEFSTSIKSDNISITPLENNNILIHIPISYQGKRVGYVWSYSNNSSFVVNSFYDITGILISILSLALLLIIIIRKYFNIIKLYLDRFSRLIIENDYKQDDILSKLPELEPVLSRITYFTDNLKQVNQELESSKLKITKIMEGISDGFFALDRDWQFTFVNQETKKIINKENTELQGRSISEVFPQVIGSLTYDKMQEAMSHNEPIHWEDEGFIGPSQNYEYHAYPFKEGLTVFFRDITELKRQQQELDRLERLNLIGQLAAGISHEIRNPLTTVKGFLQLFKSKPRYTEDKELMDLMISEIDRANAIITDFLSLAKVSLDNNKLQNINETINKLFPMLQADAFNSNKEVVLDLNSLPDIMINENEIKQLILNLVRNGLEVTAEQGSVIISTYLIKDKVVLAVKDQGSGIPQEIQEKIGTPFFTTKESGTGLGVAISIGIAQRHEAVFEFETGNNGTVFRTIFPTLEDVNMLA